MVINLSSFLLSVCSFILGVATVYVTLVPLFPSFYLYILAPASALCGYLSYLLAKKSPPQTTQNSALKATISLLSSGVFYLIAILSSFYICFLLMLFELSRERILEETPPHVISQTETRKLLLKPHLLPAVTGAKLVRFCGDGRGWEYDFPGFDHTLLEASEASEILFKLRDDKITFVPHSFEELKKLPISSQKLARLRFHSRPDPTCQKAGRLLFRLESGEYLHLAFRISDEHGVIFKTAFNHEGMDGTILGVSKSAAAPLRAALAAARRGKIRVLFPDDSSTDANTRAADTLGGSY